MKNLCLLTLSIMINVQCLYGAEWTTAALSGEIEGNDRRNWRRPTGMLQYSFSLSKACAAGGDVHLHVDNISNNEGDLLFRLEGMEIATLTTPPSISQGIDLNTRFREGRGRYFLDRPLTSDSRRIYMTVGGYYLLNNVNSGNLILVQILEFRPTERKDSIGRESTTWRFDLRFRYFTPVTEIHELNELFSNNRSEVIEMNSMVKDYVMRCEELFSAPVQSIAASNCDNMVKESQRMALRIQETLDSFRVQTTREQDRLNELQRIVNTEAVDSSVLKQAQERMRGVEEEIRLLEKGTADLNALIERLLLYEQRVVGLKRILEI